MKTLPFFKKAVANLFSKPSTVLFPMVNVDAKPHYRGRISYDPTKCVNCGMCIKVCSPGAILRTVVELENGDQQITYDFDLTSCTFCQTCEEFCNTKAIRLTEDYHMVAEDKKDLIVSGTRIKKNVGGKLTKDDSCIYCGICARTCPESAITVDRATKTWTVNHDECVQCGQCVDKCPKKSLSFGPKPAGAAASGEAQTKAAPAAQAGGAAAGGATGIRCKVEECLFCGACEGVCPVGAIKVDSGAGTWTIDRNACIQCEACVGACPQQILSLGPIEDGAAQSAPEAAVAPAAAAPAAETAKAAAPVEEAKPAESSVGAKLGAGLAGVSPDAPYGLISVSEEEKLQGIACDPDKCIYCTLCARKCPFGALEVDRANKTWTIDRDKCVLCGQCAAACPKQALDVTAVTVTRTRQSKRWKGTAEKNGLLVNVASLAPENTIAPAAAQKAPALEKAPAPEKASLASEAAPAAEGSSPASADMIRVDTTERKQGIVCDPEKCIYCTLCARKCPFSALTVDRAAKTWSIDHDACVLCGQCAAACPKQALDIAPVEVTHTRYSKRWNMK